MQNHEPFLRSGEDEVLTLHHWQYNFLLLLSTVLVRSFEEMMPFRRSEGAEDAEFETMPDLVPHTSCIGHVRISSRVSVSGKGAEMNVPPRVRSALCETQLLRRIKTSVRFRTSCDARNYSLQRSFS